MLDSRFKSKVDLFWNHLGSILVKLGMTPNMVTLAGFVLTIISCLYFLMTNNCFWFGIFLAVSFIFDYLDGAVARVSEQSTKFGSYLDAVIDRYQEIMVYFSIGFVTHYWSFVFLAVTGSLLISYNKARVAIDTPISNNNWPDLMERMERLVIICTALILEGIFQDKNILLYMILLLGILAHITAIQRFFRAKKILVKSESR
jgi:phosphatidylglycerophosphate synthase